MKNGQKSLLAIKFDQNRENKRKGEDESEESTEIVEKPKYKQLQ